MILTEEQKKEFEELTKPIMKWLCENFHPHVVVIIEPTFAKIAEESMGFPCDEFIKD